MMAAAKPYSESCDQNRDPILEVLRHVLTEPAELLEIGSGTGQHAVYFGRALPHITWQTSDRAEYLPGIRMWLAEAALPNVREPLELDVAGDWPVNNADAVYSANTAHIMSWAQVECLFAGVGRVLSAGGVFCLYGPFNYGGRFTSESNARFDAWLKARDPLSGVRDFEALEKLAEAAGLRLLHDFEMPANNRTLVWRRD